jgi:ribonuclease Y
MSIQFFIGLVAFAVGAISVWLAVKLRHRRVAGIETGAHTTAARILEEARKEADALRREAELRAKDAVAQAKAEGERLIRDERRELGLVEKRLAQKEETADRKVEALDQRDTDVTQREAALRDHERQLEERRAECARLTEAARGKLEQAAGMTREEAKRDLIQQMVDEARHDAARLIRQTEGEAREEADRRAKKIVSIAIERIAGEFVAERTVSVVPLPNDDMKGRIIGREGRNIRAIEAATGVDLIIDDTPEVVVISCHNPIRRELARLALERLVSDGRIHPGRIEEVVRKAEQELDDAIRDAGQRAVLEVGVTQSW